MTTLLFFAGLACLITGAELLVRGASAIARGLGIPPLIVGLTVVAFGTSSPELAVSVSSALSGSPDMALGNVVGSNIFNVLFILGVSALITPLAVARQLVRLDVPVMVLVSVVILIFSFDGRIGQMEGTVLTAGIVVYTAYLVRAARKERRPAVNDGDATSDPRIHPGVRFWLTNGVLVVGGLGLLVLGAEWLVTSATEIARMLGFSEVVISLTIVAAGTSLPEVVTSVLASVKGERDIAVGNVIGSNIFNLLSVLGLSSVLVPSGLSVSPNVLNFDIPFMIVVAVACLPIFFSGHTISRWEGGLFLAMYATYTTYLILKASEHDALPAYSLVMFEFAAPLLVATLGVIAWRGYRGRPRTEAGS